MSFHCTAEDALELGQGVAPASVTVPPWLRRNIGGAQATAVVGQGARRTGLIPLQLLIRRRETDHFMQVELRQLGVDNIPGLGVQRLAPAMSSMSWPWPVRSAVRRTESSRLGFQTMASR